MRITGDVAIRPLSYRSVFILLTDSWYNKPESFM